MLAWVPVCTVFVSRDLFEISVFCSSPVNFSKDKMIVSLTREAQNIMTENMQACKLRKVGLSSNKPCKCHHVALPSFDRVTYFFFFNLIYTTEQLRSRALVKRPAVAAW